MEINSINSGTGENDKINSGQGDDELTGVD
jgi:hypothetical protein